MSVGILFFALLSVEPANAETLSASQIKQEIIGKRLGYRGDYSGDIIYRRNGKISYTAAGNKLEGEWKLKGQKICTRFKNNYRGGKWSCFTFTKLSGGKYKTSLGYRVWRK